MRSFKIAALAAMLAVPAAMPVAACDYATEAHVTGSAPSSDVQAAAPSSQPAAPIAADVATPTAATQTAETSTPEPTQPKLN